MTDQDNQVDASLEEEVGKCPFAENQYMMAPRPGDGLMDEFDHYKCLIDGKDAEFGKKVDFPYDLVVRPCSMSSAKACSKYKIGIDIAAALEEAK
ncbi:hypothetical protein H6503_04725 [Candidatus Woesearchaeota archaeon]|nr:hypothetical protein [Candidatus Woesearchaeota archaeon]